MVLGDVTVVLTHASMLLRALVPQVAFDVLEASAGGRFRIHCADMLLIVVTFKGCTEYDTLPLASHG
jgi:hypothetical protein